MNCLNRISIRLFISVCLLLGASAAAQESPGQAGAKSEARKNPSATDEVLPQDPALDSARAFLHENDLPKAEGSTRTYLGEHPQSADAHFLLGFILFSEISAKWLGSTKVPGENLLYRQSDTNGDIAKFRDAKAKESLAEFTAGAKFHAPSAFDLKIVALDYILLKDYIDADHWLAQSLQRNPRDMQAWYYLGRTKYSESQFPEAIQAYVQCLKLEPRNIQAETNVGLSYEALNQPDQARQAFENAIAWEAESPAKDPGPFIELAHLYLNQNQPDKAVPSLVQAISLFPDVSKAHEELGRAYTLLHRLPEAQAALEKAVALDPEAASLHCVLGQVYRQEKLMEKATSELDRCSELHEAEQPKPAGSQ